MLNWFCKVIFTCNRCAATQRIPLRRIHFFERFHELHDRRVLLIRCPECRIGLQIPAPYRSSSGRLLSPNPESPTKDAFIHEHDC